MLTERYNEMTKRNRTKRQTMDYRIIHKKLKIEQRELTKHGIELGWSGRIKAEIKFLKEKYSKNKNKKYN